MAHYTTHTTAYSRPFEILSFSWRGSGHRAKEEQKQDYCGFRDLGPSGVLGVVSDGVGSCPRSREGAESVVAITLDTLSDAICRGINSLEAPGDHWKAWIATSIERNRTNLLQKLREPESEFSAERKIRDLFSATQLLAWTNGYQFVASLVGDGAIVGVRRELDGRLGFIKLGEAEKSGASNEVVPVTVPGWRNGWILKGPETCASLEGIILVTDGFSDVAGEQFWSFVWESLGSQPPVPPTPVASPSSVVSHSPNADPPWELPAAPSQAQPGSAATDQEDARREFLGALCAKMESGGYTADDKTLLVIRFL